MSSIALICTRHILLPSIDRQIHRTCTFLQSEKHNTMNAQLYLSRMDSDAQWIVVSNPTDKNLFMENFCMLNANLTKKYSFPKGYILASRDEVKVWCSPGQDVSFTAQQVLPPYLLWTEKKNENNENIDDDVVLRKEPFFTKKERTAMLFNEALTEGKTTFCNKKIEQ